MNKPALPIGRIRDVSAQIKTLDDRLMGNAKITMAEQSKIHAELAKLRKELDDLERRTR